MPCRHNGAMVFMVKSCTTKINQPYICPFHTPDISFLQTDAKITGHVTWIRLTVDDVFTHISQEFVKLVNLPFYCCSKFQSQSQQKECFQVWDRCELICYHEEILQNSITDMQHDELRPGDMAGNYYPSEIWKQITITIISQYMFEPHQDNT